MAAFVLTNEARADLLGIIDFIARENPDAAVRVRDRFYTTFRKLAETPGVGHYREDVLDARHRFFTLYAYVIAYRWQSVPIDIVAIVHGARDLGPFFESRPSE